MSQQYIADHEYLKINLFSTPFLLDNEQLQFEMTETEFHKAKGRLLQKEKELRDLSDEEDVHRY